MAAERIELTDLDVIARYSLAVRTASADREDLIATLRSDLAWLESLGRSASSAPASSSAAPRRAAPPVRQAASTTKAPAKKAPAKKASANAPAKKAPAKKASGRR
jgi:hypothetical protein